MSKLTHLDEQDRPHMVDVSEKKDQARTAKAEGFISLNAETLKLIGENRIKKGNVLTIAEIAGIQGAKRTSELIPLCHTLMITRVSVQCELTDQGVWIRSEVKCIGQTGVEMEALTAVNVGLLTVYDMCKAVDKAMVMSHIRLVEKIKKDL